MKKFTNLTNVNLWQEKPFKCAAIVQWHKCLPYNLTITYAMNFVKYLHANKLLKSDTVI